MKGLNFGLTKKEIAARAVLRDAWQGGHHYVELRQDGTTFVFYCTLCSTPCYSDTTLADHLKGNQHTRRLNSTTLPSSQPLGDDGDFFADKDELSNVFKGKSMSDSTTELKLNLADPFPASSIEWIGSSQVFLAEAFSDKQVQQIWCEWYGRNGTLGTREVYNGKKHEEFMHALVIFPYSDAIGRQGEWKPGGILKKGEISSLKENLRNSELKRRTARNSEPQGLSARDPHGKNTFPWEPPFGEEEITSLLSSKGLSQKALLKALKRRRMNILERVCFICHQQMLPGRDVAALLNPTTGQMMCSSRNERGAFHVFHTSCLIDWILLCESKFWRARTAKKDAPRMRGQINKKPRRVRTKTAIQSCGPLFCPECQGTGIQVRSHQLEKPRYRLVQVFDWILELLQARRLWVNCPEHRHKKSRGLLFVPEAHNKDGVVCMGSLEFYAAGSLELLVSACGSRDLPYPEILASAAHSRVFPE
ncbi:hypothetical protein KP509_20G091400 [Ceratopteris richardii]|uniref:C2H2-type domain-containing protein n=1 Tax=Ceratopteris richardii TaxID=49495 RepID=A0A8T2SKV7_CERRI|nr:hypothetical protein KP509_20G091400 [Ceratopteris richardii]KAH7332504.1 hypothetical protein KP509_20G091400 [Ceratopteris richardii]